MPSAPRVVGLFTTINLPAQKKLQAIEDVIHRKNNLVLLASLDKKPVEGRPVKSAFDN